MQLLRRFLPRSLTTEHYIFAGVILVRLVVLARLTTSPFLLPARGDMHFYDDWARRILSGQLTDHLAFYGLPLYAYFLALIYKIVGYGSFVPGLLQAMCDGGTGVILYKLSVRVFSEVRSKNAVEPSARWQAQWSVRYAQCIGTIAATGWALFMPAQTYSVILMPTAWLVFVFWLVVWLLLRRDFAPTPMSSFGYGLLIGFTAMGVATILFLVPFVLAAIGLKPVRDAAAGTLRVKLVGLVLVFAGVGIGTSPCWIHNYFVARDPVFLSAHSGVNFWIGNNPVANGYPRFPPGLHAGQEAMLDDSIRGAEKAAGHTLKRSEVSAFWSAKARAYIRSHFTDWTKLIATKIDNFWNAFQYDDLSMISALREQGVIFPSLQFGVVAALALPALLFAWRRFALSRWIIAAIALHMISLLSVFVTERYRLAAVPGLLLFAGFGIVWFWQTLVTANYRRAGAYLTLLLLSAGFVSMPARDPALWALDSYNSGWQALESNNLVLAEEKLNIAYAYVPDNAETNFALGNLQLARADRERAKSYYFATLRLDPNHEGAFNNLGVIAMQEGNWQVAAKLFANALAQDDRNAKTYYLLAQAHFHAGDIGRARIEIAQALKLNPAPVDFNQLSEQIENSSH